MEEEAGKAARKAKHVEKVKQRGKPNTDQQDALSVFLDSVWNSEHGTESSILFDSPDEILDGLAALGEDLPDIDDPTSHDDRLPRAVASGLQIRD